MNIRILKIIVIIVKVEITHEGTTIHCAGNRAHGEENLADSLANSCNASYSNIGLMLDKEAYRKTAEELLFNKKLPSCYCLTAKANFVWTKTQQTVKLWNDSNWSGKNTD